MLIHHPTWLSLVFVVCGVSASYADFPKVSRGDLEPNDARLAGPIDRSKAGELTIASVNVRNWGSRRRGLSDVEALLDLVDESDVVVFQEVGLGVFDNSEEVDTDETERLESIKALVRIYLGEDWMLVLSPSPSGFGRGAESSLFACRTEANGFDLTADWRAWIDLGPRRDLAVYSLDAVPTSGGEPTKLMIGSVHLKPDDPIRGQEMKRVADWMVDNQDANAVVCGDLNWGYPNSGPDGNQGEARFTQLHEQGKVFQVFKELSYLENDTANKLRTNMGFRVTPRFYDQIMTTPSMAARMADGGQLLDDCGVIAFGVHSPYVVRLRADLEKQLSYGLDRFLERYKDEYEFEEHLQQMEDDVRRSITRRADDLSTYIMSDHRVVWAQFRLAD